MLLVFLTSRYWSSLRKTKWVLLFSNSIAFSSCCYKLKEEGSADEDFKKAIKSYSIKMLLLIKQCHLRAKIVRVEASHWPSVNWSVFCFDYLGIIPCLVPHMFF